MNYPPSAAASVGNNTTTAAIPPPSSYQAQINGHVAISAAASSSSSASSSQSATSVSAAAPPLPPPSSRTSAAALPPAHTGRPTAATLTRSNSLTNTATSSSSPSSSSSASSSVTSSGAVPSPPVSASMIAAQVSASSRSLYVPPCRPMLRPNSLYFPIGTIPPLSCLSSFPASVLCSPPPITTPSPVNMNMGLSGSGGGGMGLGLGPASSSASSSSTTCFPVRILYADLGDPRHLLASLIDCQTKMKMWKKKKEQAENERGKKKGKQQNNNSSNNNNNNTNVKEEENETDSSSSSSSSSIPSSSSPNSLPTSFLPQTGIEFHLNDPNPHILARSILFLVSAYISSAMLNRTEAVILAAQSPISATPSACSSSSSATSTSSSSSLPPIPPLHQYSHWSAQDHWCYLFYMYACFQFPPTHQKRLKYTLELLVSLAKPCDPNYFSSHACTFFLHIPPQALHALHPIWSNWLLDCCRQPAVHIPQLEPMWRAPEGLESDVTAVLNFFYRNGSLQVPKSFLAAAKKVSKTKKKQCMHSYILIYIQRMDCMTEL